MAEEIDDGERASDERIERLSNALKHVLMEFTRSHIYERGNPQLCAYETMIALLDMAGTAIGMVLREGPIGAATLEREKFDKFSEDLLEGLWEQAHNYVAATNDPEHVARARKMAKDFLN